MENLEEKTEVTFDSAFRNAIRIAYPEARMNAHVPGAFTNIRIKILDKVGFKNLRVIEDIYKMDIEISPASNAMIIAFTPKEESEGNHG